MGRREQIKLTATLLLAVLLAIPLLSSVHEAIHEHRYCAEHQALEEVDEASAETRLPAASDADAPGFHANSNGSSTAQHVGCAFQEFTVEDTILLAGAALSSNHPTASPRQIQSLLPAATSSIAILRLAPKCSPPIS